MDENLKTACVALDALASRVLAAWTSDQTFTDALGWNTPTLTRHDLASLPSTLAADLRAANVAQLDDDIAKFVNDLPRRINVLQVQTIPQLFNGNANQSVPTFMLTIEGWRSRLISVLGWQVISDQRVLPAALARKVRAAHAEFDQLVPRLGNLTQKIADIESAHKVADSLALDLQALAEGREKLSSAAVDASISSEKAEAAFLEAKRYEQMARVSNEEAEKLIRLCEAAYQITTTKGLAGAFEVRANRLSISTWAWVTGLIMALVLGAYIGTRRLELLSVSLTAAIPNWPVISIQIALSVLSVGAPLWFAWLATKQIGQRFRLAEDYAFKASVAKAYEGYRKEAARLDPAFENQLFGSALARLDEAPLRLVETSAHGSPAHEFLNSSLFQRALSIAPELQDRLTALVRDAAAVVRRRTGEKAATVAATKTES